MGLADLLPLRDVRYINARTNHIFHASSRLFQSSLNVFEDLYRLRVGIAHTDNFSVHAGCSRARNVDIRTNFHRTGVTNDRLPRCPARNVLPFHSASNVCSFYSSACRTFVLELQPSPWSPISRRACHAVSRVWQPVH